MRMAEGSDSLLTAAHHAMFAVGVPIRSLLSRYGPAPSPTGPPRSLNRQHSPN
jgi:hypothetical protein